MAYFVLWLFSTIVAIAIAKGKGRSGGAWCLLGLVFGPFALIVAALPSLKQNPEAPTPETHVRCPDCKELVRWEAVKCRHCGSALKPLARAPGDPAPALKP